MLNRKVILNSLKKVSSIAVVSLVGLAFVGASSNVASAKRARRHTGTYRVYRHHKTYKFGYYKHGRLHYYKHGYFINRKWHRYNKKYGYGYEGYRHVVHLNSYRYNSASNWWYRKNKKHSKKNVIYPVKSFGNSRKQSKRVNKSNNNIYPVASFGNNNATKPKKQNKKQANNNVYPVNSFNNGSSKNSNNSNNITNNLDNNTSNNNEDKNNEESNNNNVDHSTYSNWSANHKPMWEITKDDNSDVGEHYVAGYHMSDHWNLVGLSAEGRLDTNNYDDYNLYKMNKDIMPNSMNKKANDTFNYYKANGSESNSNDSSITTSNSSVSDSDMNSFC